ncbi:MBL fold metallo-hydrolase [Dyella sp. GSA-30]|uniref:MBL fold metallo-hydrolase n=1 Tax=Dyella sp. GSA-30 TaxID=2994496 RepID=UPI002492B4CA|nr:MBL fold metallo-hydrolase [Dyella sp. GSA-30]BDU19617.1 MBL fold metallo-hydrolase [Dyella sp. GSA-30]
MPAIEWRIYEAGYCMHPECATRRGAPFKPARYPALAFLLRHPQQGWILFDTGYAQHFIDATRHLPERLYRAVTPVHLEPQQMLSEQLRRDGIEPKDIGIVVLSHFHGDHIAGVCDFPQARLVCAREAWNDLQARGRIDALRHGLLPKLLPDDFNERVEWIEDKPALELPAAFMAFGKGHDLLGDGSLVAIALPGHAPGHYGVVFEAAEGRRVFLVADAAWSSQAIRNDVPPPALVTGLLGDTHAYRQTLSRLHALAKAEPELRMLPSHCDEWQLA